MAVLTHMGDGSQATLFWKVSGALIGSLFLTIFYLIAKAVYNVFLHPLSKFPGPKLYAASHLPIAIDMWTGYYVQKAKALHEIYGPAVRIAPNEVVFSSPKAAHDLTTKPGLPKNQMWYLVPPGMPASIVSTQSKADHSRYRRLLAHAFSEKALREQEPLIQGYIDLLMTRLHENSGKPIDMVSWFNFTTFDIIGDLTLGDPFDCLEKSEMHPWITNTFKYVITLSHVAAIKRFPLIAKYYPYLIPKALNQSRITHMNFTTSKVQKRLANESARPDFMSYVLKHNDKETGMSEAEIMTTFATLILAGSETTATLLSIVTYYLLTYPRVLVKLVDEIRSSYEKEDEITMVSVNQQKYLLATLEEALRIQPPAPFMSMRKTPPEGADIDGQWVPGNTMVWAASHSLHRSAVNWTDPDLFVPERWLGDPRYANDDRAAFVPFSLGPRNCIGRNLAYAEMRVILAKLIWNFDLTLDEKSKNWSDQKMYFLWQKPALYVTLTPVKAKA